MTRLFLISLLAVFFFSCKSYRLPDAVEKNQVNSLVQNPYFSDASQDYVYKARIEVYGNKLGGIFVAKRISDTIHRVVFTTEFGNKLMDFEISKTAFKVNYILDDLNRKIVLKTLEEDFRLLLNTQYEVVAKWRNEESDIYQSRLKDVNVFLFLEDNPNKLHKMLVASNRKEKVVFLFESKNTTFAEHIEINHKNIKLSITLDQLSQIED